MQSTARFHADPGDARDVERTALGRRGVLRIGERSEPIDIIVLDLTRDGCGVRGDAPVEPGMQVEIGIANLGRIPATILWRGPNGFGCVFDRPLPPGSVTTALGPRNILRFPSDAIATTASQASAKLPARIRLLVIFGVVALGWTMVGGLAYTIS